MHVCLLNWCELCVRSFHWMCSLSLLNPLFTDGVQNVPRRGIFLNNSRWCIVTILPIFIFVH